MTARFRRRALSFIHAVVLGFLLAAPALAEGKLDVTGKFRASDGELDVAVYTEDKEKVGLLGIDNQGRVSFAFDKKEWSELVALWRRAEKVKSSAWKNVGEMTETGTKDISHLRIEAGPAMRFTIWSAEKGSKTCTLPAADYQRFGQALEHVRSYLAAQ